MPVQFPNLAPLQAFRPQSVSSVLMEIAKERREEERLAIQKQQEARLQKQQEVDEAQRKRQMFVDMIKEQRTLQENRMKTILDLAKMGEIDDANIKSEEWDMGVTIDTDKTVVNMPNGNTVELQGKHEDISDYFNWKIRQEQSNKTLSQTEILQYFNEHNIRPVYKAAGKAAGAKTSTAFNDVVAMNPGLSTNSPEFQRKLRERLKSDEKLTATQKDVQLVMDGLGYSKEEAIRFVKESKTKPPGQIWVDSFNKCIGAFGEETECRKQADRVLETYKKIKGEKAEPTTFDSPESVRAAVQSGEISREDGIKILQEKFGYK